MEVDCSTCGAPNPPTSKFCGSCGTGIIAGCPACHAPTTPGQRFCNECGASLGERGPTTAAPLAERRVCSVLFADLVGFTPLSESMDSEQVRELLSRYFEIARTIITRYGGVVEKFIGDAVMAIWGTPVAMEGDAERAVRAGLDLVASVSAMGTEVGAALSLRAGVITGEVAVTVGATGEGMVAGDVVNTAARIQAAAPPGAVWVDGASKRLAGAAIDFADAGEHLLKGKSDAMTLWRAGRVRSGLGGVQRVDGLEAPMTGRDVELRTIKDLFHASAERRTPRLVLISGTAGVGKSRLGWEFEKYIDGLADVAFWHRGRCLSYGDGIAFWALAEIVRQRFAIAEEDPLDVAGQKLVAGLDELVTDPAERRYIGPRLGQLLGVSYPDDGGTLLGRAELFAGWRLFFQRLAEVSPVVLLIEDAHHADAALLEFLDNLVDWTRDASIFVLIFARPELLETRPDWGRGSNRSLLTLDPLDARSMQRLLEAMVPGMPPDAMAAIAAQAQGNPLFAVETIRSLIDRDVVVPVEGVYRLVGDVGSLSAPESLHALLAARLDALVPEHRALVADAAVLGSSFTPDALAAVSGRPGALVEVALAELLRRSVFEISADPLSPQRGAYRFSQDMLRQVAYDTLSRRDRKARHLAVAAQLRASFAADGDEVAEVVARHYLDAADAVPDDPDAAEIRGQAANMLVRAGDQAVRSGATERATETYAQAADLTERAGDHIAAARLWERAATQAGVAGGHVMAAERSERARVLFAAAEMPRDAARAMITRGRSEGIIGRHAESRRTLGAALDTLRRDPDHDTVVAMRELAGLQIFAGVFAGPGGGDELSTEALVLGQALGVPDGEMANLLVTRGLFLAFTNRLVEAAAAYDHAAGMAERVGENVLRGRALLNLSSVLSDPADAMNAARTACELCRRTGARYNLSVAINNFVFATLLVGAWDEADAAVATGLDVDVLDDDYLYAVASLLAALHGDADAAETYARLPMMRASEDAQEIVAVAFADACLAALTGQHDTALRRAREALAHSAGVGVAYERLYWAWPLAVRSAFELGDLTAVQELVELVDAQPPGLVRPLLRAERSLAIARLAAARDELGADAAFAEAIGQLRNGGGPYHLAHGLLDHAEFLIAKGSPADADALIVEASEIAATLRAEPLARRAAAMLPSAAAHSAVAGGMS